MTCMKLTECQNYAQDHGYDSVEFVAQFPVGSVHCKWLDAYYGLFSIEDENGFFRVAQIVEIFGDVECEVKK